MPVVLIVKSVFSQLPSVPVSIFIHFMLCVEMVLVADEMRDAPLSLAN